MSENEKVKVEGTYADAWKPEKEGQQLIAIYLGSQEALGKRGAFKAYHFREVGTDKRWSISGANLNTIMPQIPRKTQCTITYTGTVNMPRGEMKTYEVAIPKGTKLVDPFEDDD